VASPKKWPWRRLGLWASILIVGALAGWLLATLSHSTPDNSSSFSPPTTTTPFPNQTVSVTIPTNVLYPGTGQTPDNADKVPPDQPGVVPVVIPGAGFEKLAPARELWVHQPPTSKVSTWAPTISALVVSLVALGGVLWSGNKAAATAAQTADKASATAFLTSARSQQSDARSEWFRRFGAAQELALSADGDHIKLGIKLLLLHIGSTLAGTEEKNLAQAVLAQVMEPALAPLGVDPAAPASPDQSDVHFVVTEPVKDP
jgi:hypothetical protein